MIKVYVVALVLGLLAILVIVMFGQLFDNSEKGGRDPSARLGLRGKMVVGGMVGFGLGGMAAEFSPMDLNWQISLLVATAAAVVSVVWVRYAVRLAES